MGAIVLPNAARRHPFTSRNRRRVSDNGEKVLVAPRFNPQNAEAVLLVVERDPLHKPGKNLTRFVSFRPDGARRPLFRLHSQLEPLKPHRQAIPIRLVPFPMGQMYGRAFQALQRFEHGDRGDVKFVSRVRLQGKPDTRAPIRALAARRPGNLAL